MLCEEGISLIASRILRQQISQNLSAVTVRHISFIILTKHYKQKKRKRKMVEEESDFQYVKTELDQIHLDIEAGLEELSDQGGEVFNALLLQLREKEAYAVQCGVQFQKRVLEQVSQLATKDEELE